MARKGTTSGAATAQPDAGTAGTDTLTPEQETAPGPSTEETPGPALAAAESKPDEKKKDDKTAELEAFKTVVASAVKARDAEDEDTSYGSDANTGAVSDEVLANVVTAYQALTGDRKAQNAAKATLIEGLGHAVDAEDIRSARAYLAVQKAIDEAGPSKATVHRAPVDPTEAFVSLYSTLDLALFTAYNTVPEGVAEDWPTRAEERSNAAQGELTTYLAWLAAPEVDRGDEPNVSAMVKDAVKLAQGKSVTGRKLGGGGRKTPFEGERGDIAKHITQAFEGVPVGDSLTVAEIVGKQSKGAGYDDRKPSQGAVSSRLKSAAWSVEQTGIEPVAGSTPFAARKVAEVKAA